MKRDLLRLSPHQTVETFRDYNGRHYIAYSSGASVFISDRKELVRFLKIPKSIPMRITLDEWLSSLEEADAKRKGPKIEPVGDANVEGSFDPLAHALDESDPNYQTRTVI